MVNERQLLHEYKINGNIDALQSLVVMHKGFVHFVVKKYHRYDSNNFDDMVQEGLLGLIHAINKYDLQYETKLISYAVYWIKYYISKYLKFQYRYTAVDTEDEWEDCKPSPEIQVATSMLHEKIDEAAYKVLQDADGREKDIFNARYREAQEVSFEELGERHKISRQRAHAISSRTIDKIRKEL